MLNFISHDGVTNTLRNFLVVKLGRMHSNNNQLVAVLLFQKFQIRKHMHAVDAAVGPEVQDHDLSSQVLQIDWL